MIVAGDFAAFYEGVHGDGPFPWQEDLARTVVESGWPDTIDVPTGLGKTSVVDVAVFAQAARLANGASDAWTRTFVVVDRRIIVDAAFEHAAVLAAGLREPRNEAVAAVADALRRRAVATSTAPLEVRRLRGGLTWESQWLRRPEQPAVVTGTVDQLGSRLLFRGYGVTPRWRPIDAALCGTDSLLILDEAHLARPFLETLDAAMAYEATSSEHPLPGRPVRRVSMSATVPAGPTTFTIDLDRHLGHPIAGPRLRAAKDVVLADVSKRCTKREQLATELARAAQALVDAGAQRVGVIANRVATARRAFEELSSDVERHLLIGPVRGFDRDATLEEALPRVRARAPEAIDRPVVVVATQTIEVGADLSFDALVTEVAPLDALIQRFGRVARLGTPNRSTSVVVRSDRLHQVGDPVYRDALDRTWHWLAERAGSVLTPSGRGPIPLDVSSLDFGPLALTVLRTDAPADLTPEAPSPPVVLGPTLDAWARTEPQPLPDQPVAPYLHGLQAGEPEVHVCWRADLDPGAVGAMPPQPAESVAMPLWAARRLLAGAPGLDELSDAPAVAPTSSEVPGAGASVGGVVVRGRRDQRPVAPSDLRPGDVLVLPMAAGGHDRYGLSVENDEPVPDIGDLVRTARPGIRLRSAVVAGMIGQHEVVEEQLQLFERPSSDGEDAGLPTVEEARAALRSIATAAAEVGGRYGSALADLAARLAADSRLQLRRVASNHWIAEGGSTLRSVTSDNDDSDDAASSTSDRFVTLERHGVAVGERAAEIAARIGMAPQLVETLRLAGRAHDIGKADPRFQVLLFGDPWLAAAASEPVAKSDRDDRERQRSAGEGAWPAGYRHEAISAMLVRSAMESGDLASTDDPDLLIHLVATHHGWARPLTKAVHDPMPEEVQVKVPGTTTVAVRLPHDEVMDWDGPERFARLCRRYGWWGLALLETVLRLADVGCSREGT